MSWQFRGQALLMTNSTGGKKRRAPRSYGNLRAHDLGFARPRRPGTPKPITADRHSARPPAPRARGLRYHISAAIAS